MPRKPKRKNPNNGRGYLSLAKRVRLNNMVFPQTIRCTTPDLKSTVVTSASFAFFLNYPTYFRADSGTIGQMSNVAGVMAQDQKSNDEYKVVRLDLWYMPLLQNTTPLSSYTTAAGNTGVTQVAPSFDASICTALDLDDSALLTNASKALNAQGYKGIKSRVGNAPIFLTSMTQVDPVEKMKWLNLGAIVPNVSTPPDPNNPAKLASIKAFTGLILPTNAYPITNTTIGGFIAEWLVLLRGSYMLA